MKTIKEAYSIELSRLGAGRSSLIEYAKNKDEAILLLFKKAIKYKLEIGVDGKDIIGCSDVERKPSNDIVLFEKNKMLRHEAEDWMIVEASGIPPHQHRVIDEKNELEARLTKLSTFMSGNSIFEGLPCKEKDMLKAKHTSMSAYLSILNDRIANF